MPERIQLSRRKGWRKPAGAVVVSRPSKWGNPVRWEARSEFDPATGETHPPDVAAARRISVEGFRKVLSDRNLRVEYTVPSDDEIRAELAGKDLACWCPLDQACHADVLLEIANSGEEA